MTTQEEIYGRNSDGRYTDYMGKNTVDPLFTTPFTQDSFAGYVVRKANGTIMYVPSIGWRRVDANGIWCTLTKEEIMKMIRDHIHLAINEVELTTLSLDAKNLLRGELLRSLTVPFINNVLGMMAVQNDVMVKNHVFDSDIHLVGFKNGECYDLQKLEVRKIRPSDYLMSHLGTHYDEKADCPIWKECLKVWTQNDEELEQYLQNYSGYCLSGETKLQWLNFLYGTGCNGKSVFQSIIMEIMNMHGKTVDASTLIDGKRNGGAASSDIARLAGARVAFTTEMPSGRAFNEELVKSITGGDTLTAGRMYCEEFEFKPQLKLFVVGNHLPEIRATNHGIWRRMKIVPFMAKIETPDPDLHGKLKNELPGIVNWMIEGWKNYKREGTINIPSAVKEASDSYRENMDVMEEWIMSCLENSPDFRERSSSMYASYKEWCYRNTYTPLSSPKWNHEFEAKIPKENQKTRMNGGYYFRNMKLKDSAHT